MRKLLVLLIAAFGVAAAPAQAASPFGTTPDCVNALDAYGVQEWDISANAPVTGDHLHTEWCGPFLRDWAGYDVDVRTVLHNNTGMATFMRYSVQSTVKQSISFKFQPGPVSEASRVDTVTIPRNAGTAGWNEIRLTSNIAAGAGSPKGRWYTTTRFCVNLGPLANPPSSGYCGGPTVKGRCGGGGNYRDVYDIAWIDCRDLFYARETKANGISGAWCPRLRFDHAYRNVATIDPHFHDGDVGRIFFDSAPKTSSACFDTRLLSNGVHTMHIRTERQAGSERFAGAFTFKFRVLN